MNFEDQESSIMSARKRQLAWIYALACMDAFLLYYLYFGNGSIGQSIVKFFIFATSVCIFFQVKNLKENPVGLRRNYGLAEDTKNMPFSQMDRIANSIKNFSKIQFSQNTIGRAEEILNKSAVKKRDFNDASYIQPDSKEGQNYVEEDRFRGVRYRTRNDRSVLDDISMDWPTRMMSDKRSGIRDMREQPRRNPSSNINASRNVSRNIIGQSESKRNNSYLSRQESNKDPKRTVSRYSSKGKNTLQKASVNTKSFYHLEAPLDLEIANERQKNFQTLLSNLHIDFRKYDYWVHHNIQVWLAFNFLPELVKRNHVSL